MKRVVLRRVAEREFEESIEYYDTQHEGLGQEFRAVVEEYIQKIADDPAQFPKVMGEVQRAVVQRRFPFVIHFVVEAEQVVVLSVFHTSRDPSKLRNRR